jgi:hypothetical protein
MTKTNNNNNNNNKKKKKPDSSGDSFCNNWSVYQEDKNPNCTYTQKKAAKYVKQNLIEFKREINRSIIILFVVVVVVVFGHTGI